MVFVAIIMNLSRLDFSLFHQEIQKAVNELLATLPTKHRSIWDMIKQERWLILY